jgi:hypothetical protein
MGRLFVVSYVTLWLVTCSLFVLVLLLFRQFGTMLMPGRRRIELGGLDIGERAPELVVDLPTEGRSSLLTWEKRTDGKSATLVVVAEPHCPICKGLLKEGGIASVPQRNDVEFVWLDEKKPDHDIPVYWTVAVADDGSAARLLDVPGFPFAYVLGSDGQVLAKGLVNSGEEISSLIGRAGRFEPSLSPSEVQHE